MAVKIWKKRPPASSLGGQVAWDMLSPEFPEHPIVELWYARDMDDGAWCARFSNGECRDVDVLVTRHRVNRIRSVQAHFEAGHYAAVKGIVPDERELWLAAGTVENDRKAFEEGVAQGERDNASKTASSTKT
jgi:hypothetical protein